MGKKHFTEEQIAFALRQAEIERVRRMTVEERVKAALGLAARFAALRPSPREA